MDASVIIAGLMSDGRARRVILHAEVGFYAPPLVMEEVHERVGRIAQKADLPVQIVETVLRDLEDRIEIVAAGVIDAYTDEAHRLAEAADAQGDEDYIALALALGAPVWTYDKDFARVDGLRLVGTAEVEAGLTGEKPG